MAEQPDENILQQLRSSDPHEATVSRAW